MRALLSCARRCAYACAVADSPVTVLSVNSAVVKTFAFADPYQGGAPVAVSVVLGGHDGPRGAIATGARSSSFTAWIADGGLCFDGPLLDGAIESDELALRTVLHCALERDDVLIAVVRSALEQQGDGTHAPLASIVDSAVSDAAAATALRQHFVMVGEPHLIGV